MIQIRLIDAESQGDIRLANESFSLFGRLIPVYDGESWSWHSQLFPEEERSRMCFPDEAYDYEAMKEDHYFLGAYEGGRCVGLAILRQSWNRWLYLYDLKVQESCRRSGVGQALLNRAGALALEKGYLGLWTVGQDNNLAACLFYLKQGFVIGGLDTHVYHGTSQQGKADIYFYKQY